MKIKLKQDQIAVLKEESGEIVGCFRPNEDAKQAMETAVCLHFDIAGCNLSDERDFTPPLDYEQPYVFHLYTKDEDEYVTLTMTYEYIYWPMKTPTIIIEVRGGIIQMIGSTTKNVNIIVVDHDHHEVGDQEAILEDIKNNLLIQEVDIVKANHKLLVDAMFSECHDEIDQAIYDRLQEIGQEVEA